VVVSMRKTRPNLSYILMLEGRHVMANPGSLNPGIEVVAQLGAEVAGQTSAQESRDVLGLDGMDRGTADRLIEWGQGIAVAKDDVGGVLDLQDAPVVAGAELLEHRTALSGIAVEHTVQFADIETVGELLSLAEIAHGDEGVIDKLVLDASLIESGRQAIVPV